MHMTEVPDMSQPVDPTATGVLPPALDPSIAPDSSQVHSRPSTSASSTDIPESMHAPRRHAISLDDAEAIIEEDEVGSPWDFPWD